MSKRVRILKELEIVDWLNINCIMNKTFIIKKKKKIKVKKTIHKNTENEKKKNLFKLSPHLNEDLKKVIIK